jgi:ribosome-associated protein
MIQVTSDIFVDESELDLRFVRAGGPGGQHVNKSSTAVQLRFDAAGSPNLPYRVKERLGELAGQRLTAEGELVINAREHRSQEMNRQAAVSRLVALLRLAAEEPAPRKPTRPGRAAKRRRVEHKRRRGQRKQLRGKVRPDQE